ncbi:MAG: ABC transporter permease subunit [Oscillospiraceae bacterium]|nr:ABC transporter permease subunit [Oscillospiraceae bacterium]
MEKLKKLANTKYFMTIMWILILVALWEVFAIIVSHTKRTPENILPHLSGIIESVFSRRTVNGDQTAVKMVMVNAAATLSRAGIGYVVGIVSGFALALLMSLWKPIEKIAFPYLMLIQMIPILGMAPIINALTGDINKSRIVIAAILTFYPVATNTLAGFKSVQKEKHELMYSYAAGKIRIYTKMMIPSCIPYFFTGLKISAPMAITASILVDTLQGGIGLGCLLSQALKGAMTRYVFWQIVFFSAIIGILSFSIMGLLEYIICPYKRTQKN